MKKTIIRYPGGTARHEVLIDDVRVEDLWHIAYAQESIEAREAILSVWHLAHDLLWNIKETSNQ